MNIKGIITEDFINYKKVSMTIIMPYCDFKCGKQICQNNELASAPIINIPENEIIKMYLSNPISQAIVFQGLEPFDSWRELIKIIDSFRLYTQDDIVIYTGYTKEELLNKHYLPLLKKYHNIIIKYGRFLINHNKHFDSILGVYLASNNQFAEKIS